ncbi:BCHE [Cordylochernes scorpioides]|uniref:Carboxylic ester hydrolase n=1 Tax=Cordylochernes scorpioides TaxID=51811 RepID=A0ABY6LAZ2_9ARAC|nr:BCHE [Cordylochernes scorpioides]
MKDILGVRRLNAVLVPKDLTFDQKNARKVAASLNLEATTDDPKFLKRVITGDETCIYGFDSETTQQTSEWRFKNEPRPKKARKAPRKVKVMLTVGIEEGHEGDPENRLPEVFCDWKKGRVIQFVSPCLIAIAMASVVPPTVRLPETETLITGSQQTVSGKLLDVYLSIPYAQPPTGERRFKDPEPITNLPPQINATQFPPSCCQINFEPIDHVNEIMSEDCLYLNIWTPSQKSHMSVLIFIYGGSFEFGSTDELMNNPQYLAARTDMVIVTMNYRVGAFGFIDLKIEGADGNLGLKDQILAFKWVKKNIRAFGGNPESVTLYGTSAGSMAVALHLSLEENRDLFHRAFLQSGTSNSGFFHFSNDLKNRELDKFFEFLNCRENSFSVLECLQSKTSKQILDAEIEAFLSFVSVTFIPNFNRKLFSLSPIKDLNKTNILLNKDILIGITKDEGSISIDSTNYYFKNSNVTKQDAITFFYESFGQSHSSEFIKNINGYLKDVSEHDYNNYSKAFKELLEDYYFRCPTFYFSNVMASKNNNVYFYYFTYQSEHKANNESIRHHGATHNEDLQYTMGLPRRDSINYTLKEIEFSNTMMDYIGNFSKYG